MESLVPGEKSLQQFTPKRIAVVAVFLFLCRVKGFVDMSGDRHEQPFSFCCSFPMWGNAPAVQGEVSGARPGASADATVSGGRGSFGCSRTSQPKG